MSQQASFNVGTAQPENVVADEVPKRINFQPNVHGSSFENLMRDYTNTGDFVVCGYYFLPAQETLRKISPVGRIYVVDPNGRIGELVSFEDGLQDWGITAGVVLRIENFGVDGRTGDGFYNIMIRTLDSVSVNKTFNPLTLKLASPNTYEEMKFTFSNCQLRYHHTFETKFVGNDQVKSIVFETNDGREVELNFWNDKIIQFPTFELIRGEIYRIVGATKGISTYFDMSLQAHELTEIYELEEEEDNEKLPNFNKITARDLGQLKKGTFTVVTECIENFQQGNFLVGIIDGSENEDGKLLAMECVVPTQLDQGETFSCNITVELKYNGRHRGTISEVENISDGETIGECKFF